MLQRSKVGVVTAYRDVTVYRAWLSYRELHIDRRVVTYLWASPVWRQTGQAQKNGAHWLRSGTTCTSTRFFAKYTHFAIVFAGSAERGTLGRLRERAKRDESDSGDGSGNVSGAGLDPTGSGHSSRRVQGLWLARPIESDSRQILTFFFDSVGFWTTSTSDSVVGLCPFRQQGIWTLDSVDFDAAWTFSVEMSGSSCSASGRPTPTTTPSSCSFTSLSRKIIKSKSQWTQRTKQNLCIRPRPRLGGLAVACLADPGRRPCAIFFWRHTSLRLVTSGLTSFLLVTSASRVTSVWLVLVSFRVFS